MTNIIDMEESKKQSALYTPIKLENIHIIEELKKEHIYIFYKRYKRNYDNNYILAKAKFIEAGGSEEEFELPEEVKRALIASLRRQIKRQCKVEMLNAMFKNNAFTKINTVVLQKITEELFSKGIDKDFITKKIKEYNDIYKKPRRNENLAFSYNKEIAQKMTDKYKEIVYMPLHKLEKIHDEIQIKIDKRELSIEDIKNEYLISNPNTEVI